MTEGNGSKDLTFTATLSAPSGRAVQATYTTANGPPPAGAVAPGDYTATSGTMTFQSRPDVEARALHDRRRRRGRTQRGLPRDLAGARNAQIADGQGIGTILNDDRSNVSVAGPAPLGVPVVGDRVSEGAWQFR